MRYSFWKYHSKDQQFNYWNLLILYIIVSIVDLIDYVDPSITRHTDSGDQRELNRSSFKKF